MTLRKPKSASIVMMIIALLFFAIFSVSSQLSYALADFNFGAAGAGIATQILEKL